MKPLCAATVLFAARALMACGGGGTAGPQAALPTPVAIAAASVAPSVVSTGSDGRVSLSVVDYFTGAAIAATVAVEGVAVAGAGGVYVVTPTPGVHAFEISAGGYATYNDAIQLPGGAATRIIKLFPVTPAMSSWLAQINADRAANGAGAVQLDDMLSIAAFDHAVDMGARGYFAHFDPHGFAPTTRSLLLGSMLVGSENIAAGFSSWTGAEYAFMNERTILPNRSPADCKANGDLAGHFCNIVSASHNRIGLAIANVPSSPNGLYYDQEFGDFYASYDTSVVPPEPALGLRATLSVVNAGGAAVTGAYIGTMAAPQPISISVLNADPTCATLCPGVDQWYPSTVAYVSGKPQIPLSLDQNQIYFSLSSTSVPNVFVGYGSYAAYWAGGTVRPDQYVTASVNVQTQSTTRAVATAEHGLLVPNGPTLLESGL